ncbi:MAG: Uma2 family endonuclease [Candidatus Rokubacteria bacterium]|nr:Uma2 family endonuclease [Candidatus Rokubacteria bacterium]
MGIGIKQKLDYSDLAHTPDDGLRYEIIEGELHVTPAPSPIHQRVSRRLQRTFEDYFHPRGLGEVFNAPVDVVLTWHDVVEPDLILVADPDDRTLECHRLEGGAFRLVVHGQGDVSVTHPDWSGLTIDLTELWR